MIFNLKYLIYTTNIFPKMKLYLFIILFLIGFKIHAQSGNISFSIFMVGYSGKYEATNPDHKRLYETIINYNNNPKGIIFLGNNVMPKLGEAMSDDFDKLNVELNFSAFRDFNGPICFVPGLSDWAYGTSNGKEMVKWEYKAIHSQLKGNNVYIPDPACPGPLEVEINDSLVIILIDTQWWLHPFDTRFEKCDLEDESDFWTALQDALRRNRQKKIVVAGYHPLVSFGIYGGRVPPLASIFPVPIYRKFLGSRLDLAHPLYKLFAENLKLVLNEFKNVVYASSHEQNFQYINQNNIHQIIGGTLPKGKYIKKEKLVYGSREPGYSRLNFYDDGRVQLQFYHLNNPEEPIWGKVLYSFKNQNEILNTVTELFPDSISQPANIQYQISPKLHKWMGKNYRKIWGASVKVPVFDMENDQGELEIIKRGGGQQTQSFRLKAKNKHQYVLRSIEKNVEGALPVEMKNTIAMDIVQDNISASNPYAALPVAKLAHAAGVMHTNPKIVYLPNDNRLGEYKEDMAGSLFLFEERPLGNWEKMENFGYSKDIKGTPDVVEQIEDSPQSKTDQGATLKARLFDTFINDWDRHDDQWTWASFKENGTTVYRPIPRDRDQAFYVNQGFLPRLASMNWLMPKIQGFTSINPNMRGLTYNARYFDRYFLTQPDWQQWGKTIDTLQAALTDSVIENAMLAFPKEIQPLVADKTAETLKKRRDNLETMAWQHYLLLAKNVSPLGTNDDELFRVTRKNNEETEVSVFELSNKKHKQKDIIYHRIFKTDETKEIRLYGLGGDDVFKLDGDVDKGIKIRIIGGKGNDSIINQSNVKAAGKQTVVYDLIKNTTLEASKDTRNKLSENNAVNEYDRLGFRYNIVTPGAFLGYNIDDGVFIGGGPVYNKYLFRRNNKYSVLANYAALTGAFNLRLGFDSESEMKGIDRHFAFDLKAPDYSLNYFGMGNETQRTQSSKGYYRMRANIMVLDYSLGYRFGKTASKNIEGRSINESKLSAGVFLKSSDLEMEDNIGRFIADFSKNGLTTSDLSRQLFTGGYVWYLYSNLDEPGNPHRGIWLSITGKQFFDLKNNYDSFFNLDTDFRAYLSFTRNPRAVFAFRLGGESLFGGKYLFLEAAKLGGKTNLRGYLADRFYGDQIIFQNTELRFKLIDFSSYILNGELGVFGFYDSGRVWYNNEGAGNWHSGYGGGFWLSPFEMTILTVSYNIGEEDKLLQATVNFKF